MKKIFYGAAIQGAQDRRARAHIHRGLIEHIKGRGFAVAFEHTCGETVEQTAELLEKALGPLPPTGMERTVYVRRKIVEAVESDVAGYIFEVSTPALGTGIELAHAYLRPRLGLSEVPILLLYERDFWPNKLTSMIRGITPEEIPSLVLKEYVDLEEAKSHVSEFLETLSV
ncbi:MAG: hypothetical protein ACYTAO_10650 [Planctomycetota bacterium]|jgi:hypothetical protein